MVCPGTDADVGTVTFQSRDSFVEFVVDAVDDVSFSFLPVNSRHPPSLSSLDVGSAAVRQLILLALSDNHDRVLSVYIEHDNVTESDNVAESDNVTG